MSSDELDDTPKRSDLVDWPKVVTNAVSALIATTFIGAGAIVWQAAVRQPQAIQSKVDEAKDEIQATQDSIQATQQSIITTQDQFSEQIADVRIRLDSLREELQAYAEARQEAADPPPGGEPPSPEETTERWFKEKEVEVSKVLDEKTMILNDLDIRLQAERNRALQFNPAQHAQPE